MPRCPRLLGGKVAIQLNGKWGWACAWTTLSRECEARACPLLGVSGQSHRAIVNAQWLALSASTPRKATDRSENCKVLELGKPNQHFEESRRDASLSTHGIAQPKIRAPTSSKVLFRLRCREAVINWQLRRHESLSWKTSVRAGRFRAFLFLDARELPTSGPISRTRTS